MNIPYTHESVRLTGRWHCGARSAVTTATGAYIEFAFRGTMALAKFDTLENAQPYLHLWVQLDGGNMTEVPLDSYLRVIAKEEGDHLCRIIYKGGTEQHRRWSAPLTGKVSFLGVQTAEPLPLAEDPRKTIEFVGDSITEGVLVDADFAAGGEALPTCIDQNFRCYQDDVCGTYAWRIAETLNLRPVFMGYGAVGATRGGCGGVPDAAAAYPFNFEGSPVTRKNPDYILINHGTNDGYQPAEVFLPCYAKLLDQILAMNPSAKLVCVSPFGGAFHTELGELVRSYNAEHGTDIGYVDTAGWIPANPVHPLRDGHRAVAERMIPLLREMLKL